MIAALKGVVFQQERGCLILLVQGVGYKVFVPETVLINLQPQDEIFLYTRLVVREDSWELYGFTQQSDCSFFELLLEASGIGPKSALALINSTGCQQLAAAILQEDVAALTNCPGVGAKTAQRLILDLQSKVQRWMLSYAPEGYLKMPTNQQEVVAALCSLGYSLKEAQQATRAAMIDTGSENLSTEEWLKRALQQIAKRVYADG